jgi:hypothetical protein
VIDIADNAASFHQRISIAAGELDLHVRRAELPLAALCGFGTRRNTRRGFLFISRVLGRHLPVRPHVMRDVQCRLAARIPADLPGPVVMIGMAETAIGLAHGVYEEYLRRSGRQDALFLHSTRFRLEQPPAFDFQEEHSHASGHLVYAPAAAEERELFRSARTLVLLDDEASTGTTFVNLARAFARTHTHFERMVSVVITNWLGREREADFARALPAPSTLVSLLDGDYTFTPAASAAPADAPSVVGNGDLKDALLTRNDGRLGHRGLVDVPAAVVERARVRPGERVLVLGPAEFVYVPFRLAEALAGQGAEVWCQATTRSPVQVGNDVACALTFADNYGDGIPNFLYNVRPGQYDRVFICYETPMHTVQHDLLATLDATPILFGAP